MFAPCDTRGMFRGATLLSSLAAVVIGGVSLAAGWVIVAIPILLLALRAWLDPRDSALTVR